jgi:hypothetical protein
MWCVDRDCIHGRSNGRVKLICTITIREIYQTRHSAQFEVGSLVTAQRVADQLVLVFVKWMQVVPVCVLVTQI